MQFKVGFCDDEQMILKVNQVYIEEIAKKNKVSICTYFASSGSEMLELTKKEKLHIVFMDIDLQGMSGIETAIKMKQYNKDLMVVFLTAHREFALEAFEVDAVGYLMKPVDPLKLEKAFIKAIKQLILESSKATSERLVITEDNIKKRLPQYKIICIEKQKNRCIAYMQDSTHFFYDTISNVRCRLNKSFYQINQGVLVNLKYINNVNGNEIELKNGRFYSVSRKYIKEVKAAVYGG